MTNFKENLIKVKAFIFDIDGVLSLQTIGLNAFGVPGRTVNLRDGYALQYAIRKGYRVGVISGSRSKEYQKRLKLLGVKDIYLNSKSKLDHFNSFLKKHSLDKSEVLFMGDDIPDYEVMKEAGVPVCPSDADSEIKQVAVYISDKRGGEGCVRDVIEQVLRLHNQWMDSDAFSW
ncbi:MAG: 3-deoxy-D-manno-octulosonate 8-phosphate phosphatase [Bacteroidetes bacterium GWE2_41_25]|nr:MAG: 3-deoxy-D-manno-octulosonate 8-phosphate phosphatase [Bacteroidetes bacterium GWA2_40_15]OFX86120.1 MAG: 3-deoxy-D-manno-octulosonate 8-phosphate phosphatase [Bacteroidetes bacterium GWC2_40_22]OFY12750.1 MAG: 3-deoxy-D-manno-octulosonate 8-phosphate phosphatase [Bacteroidetes bacterium GWE2_41_25]OFY59219.1 MAG: 3-deoxy-D-manno-octulosonate 8-phosphate phosphatase [Bacteroidetes bacterium GWF2_41_9]HAM10355.1 3-deoxy-D-manno-octulosonate 8-phosphate phosphatase [Bacteroidales bacterium